MKQFTVLILVFILCSNTYGQFKSQPNGKFFNYKGIKIYYEDSGTGEPLLLLHGFLGTADDWKPYVDAYARQFRTIAVDMIGHGRSDIFKKDDTSFTHAHYAQVIIGLLDSLKLTKVNAIGASSGGITLLYLNTIQPARFKKVIAIGAIHYRSIYSRQWITKTGLNQFTQWAQPHGPEKQNLLAKQFWQMRNQLGDPSFTPDILNTISADWLVVHGDNDQAVPLEQAVEMHQHIPHSRLWIVPNGGHLPHMIPDNQPGFLKVSLEFLNGKWNRAR